MPLKRTCDIGFFVNWKINKNCCHRRYELHKHSIKIHKTCRQFRRRSLRNLFQFIIKSANYSPSQEPQFCVESIALSGHNLCCAKTAQRWQQNPYHKFHIADVIEKTCCLICSRSRSGPERNDDQDHPFNDV